MQIHLLSSQSSASQADSEHTDPSETAVGHPLHLPQDLSTALRDQGHRVEVDLLGDDLHGRELHSLREAATAGRRIAARLNESNETDCVLHALDAVSWAAALTARSLSDVSVVLRLAEPTLADGHSDLTNLGSGKPGSGDLGSGRVSTIGPATERRAYRACLRAADAVAATEDEDRWAAVRAGVPKDRALIVPDVVGGPADEAVPTVRQPGRILLSFNGIGPDSGIGTLLAALNRLPERELVVTGPGNQADLASLRRRLEESALTDRVHWQGQVDRATTLRLLDAAALLILPSPIAAASTAILAMTRSRAVVTVGGPAADVVVDGITGSVLPKAQPELLAPILRALLNNPFRLQAMGLAGRERALTRYARERAVSATEQAYRVALGAA